MDVSQYLEIFIDETEEHLQTLSDCIMELEKEPENMDTINEILRAAHSLKGMAGTMGFKRMQRLTHDMENVFQEVRSDKVKVNSNMIDLLFKCLDAIESYLNNVKASSDEGTEDNELIIKELNDFIAGEENAEKKEEEAPAPKKENTDDAAKNGEKKYFEFELNSSDRTKLKEAENNGLHIYGMTVYQIRRGSRKQSIWTYRIYPERMSVKSCSCILSIQGSRGIWRNHCIQSNFTGNRR